ncbi:hypothetical protein [Tenacibaculum sp. 190524A05c]|uniref:hypothetical protein n=1 Tax=Tenacibaculum platacis TaxID=3137852 RepID=UPI0031FA880E
MNLDLMAVIGGFIAIGFVVYFKRENMRLEEENERLTNENINLVKRVKLNK